MATTRIVPQQLKDLTEGWSKWDIALYVGAPIALGLAGLWYYNRSKPQSDTKQAFLGAGDSETAKTKPEVANTSGKASPKTPAKPQVDLHII